METRVTGTRGPPIARVQPAHIAFGLSLSSLSEAQRHLGETPLLPGLSHAHRFMDRTLQGQGNTCQAEHGLGQQAAHTQLALSHVLGLHTELTG
jgi:hypothetical protein